MVRFLGLWAVRFLGLWTVLFVVGLLSVEESRACNVKGLVAETTTLRSGEVVPGTPLIYSILDVEERKVRDVTVAFWVRTNKTVPDSTHKVLLGLGMSKTDLISRWNKGMIRNRNSFWSKDGWPSLSMGYSKVEESWVHIAFTIEDSVMTLFVDGYPTGERSLDRAFYDLDLGEKVGFVSLPEYGKRKDKAEAEIKELFVDQAVWKPDCIRQYVLESAPKGSHLNRTRIPEQGIHPKLKAVFREEYLFGNMPEPYVFPRLNFGPQDIPRVRKLFTANDRMGMHLANAERQVEFCNKDENLLEFGVSKDPSEKDVNDIWGMLFAAIIVDDNQCHQKLAKTVMNIFRRRRPQIEEALGKDTRNEWERHGLDKLYYKDGLAVMLDLAGMKLTMAEKKEAVEILSLGPRGRRAIYTKHVTAEPFEIYSKSRAYGPYRRGSNRDVWGGTTLATNHLLLHGHEGFYDPNDIKTTYNVFQEQVRTTLSSKGTSTESAGKTALWRAFLPWMMLARHRIPGIDTNIWNVDRVQQYGRQKEMQIMPVAPLIADLGTYARSEPREVWAAFYTLLDDPANAKRYAWVSRVVDPRPPLSYEMTKMLFAEQGTGYFSNSGNHDRKLLLLDEDWPIQPVYGRSGQAIGFMNSNRSCVLGDGPLNISFSENWSWKLKIRTSQTSDGHLAALFETGAVKDAVVYLSVQHEGTRLELKVFGKTSYISLAPGIWQSVVVRAANGSISIGSEELSFKGVENFGDMNIVIGAFRSISRRLKANQKGSRTGIAEIVVRKENGYRPYRWDTFPLHVFGRDLMEDVNPLSMFDAKHWSDDIEYSDSPTHKIDRDFFDDSVGFYSFAASPNETASSVYIYAQDIPGGHVPKAAGHFDVYGVGTGWLFIENRLCSGAQNFNTILVNGKSAPGLISAEQGISVGGAVTKIGSWVEIDLTWFYRHEELIRDVNNFGFDESVRLPRTVPNVKFASRVISHVPIGPPHRAVTIIRDKIVMNVKKKHTFTWLGQVMERHGVRVTQNSELDTLDIWLTGDGDIDFSDSLRKYAPFSVFSIDYPDQFSAKLPGVRKCLIRVLHANSVRRVSGSYRNRYRMPLYKQGVKYQTVLDKPSGDITKRIAKQLRIFAKAEEGHFVIAIYPMLEGEAIPTMSWSNKTDEVTIQHDSESRVVRADGSVVADHEL